MKHAILASACALALFLPQDPDDEARPKTPEVGDAAPVIRLNDHNGEATTVGGESESWTVLAYYPMAMTPGWTVEVCSLRDAATMFDELGVTVVGISTDDVKSQAQFVEEQELGFELLSDPDRSASAKYGVLSQRGWANRVTFIIDEEGILRHIDKQVNVRSHGEDLAQTIARLQSE